jgi:hypothetical protein
MAYQSDKVSFVLYVNKRKTAPNHPDYTGKMSYPDGSAFEVAAWLKPGKGGQADFITGTLGKPWGEWEKGRQQQPVQQSTPAPMQPAVASTEVDDDIPF